jgi:large subunit ribosomal protein L19e
MNLKKKKKLIARTMGIGIARIALVQSRIDDIKDAITKQDIRDLVNDKAIIIKSIKGKRKKGKRKIRSFGSIKKKIKRRKRGYLLLTRKLRNYLLQLKRQEKVNKEEYRKIRSQIRARIFRSKSHMKELVEK